MHELPPIDRQPLDDATIVRLVGRPDPVILDVGCNDGEHTRRFLRLFPKGRVHAFEPDPRPRERFERTVRNARAKLWPLAIAAQDGEAEFHMSSGEHAPGGPTKHAWDQSGSLRQPRKHRDIFPQVKFETTLRVRTMRLDTFAREQKLRRVDFLWADVQGAESDLIAGAQETLKMTRFLHTEYSNVELYAGQLGLAQLLELLPDFEVVRRFPLDALLRNRRLAGPSR